MGEIKKLTDIVVAVDEALGHGADERLWPPGMSRGEAVARLIAETERLREATKRHRRDVWGQGPVEHDHDVELYAAVLGEGK